MSAATAPAIAAAQTDPTTPSRPLARFAEHALREHVLADTILAGTAVTHAETAETAETAAIATIATIAETTIVAAADAQTIRATTGPTLFLTQPAVL